MTTAEVKNILKSVRKAEKTYKLACDTFRHYEELLTGGKPVRLPGETKTERHGNPTENALIRLADYGAERDKAAEELTAARSRAKELIALAGSQNEREVLTRRYINGELWEEIAEKMHYSVRRILQLHGSALQNISLNFT